jgi:sec-independent protein translocase protein TatA
MGSFSIWHWLVVLVIVLLLFGAGKIPKLMGDMAKGVKAFKEGLKDMNEENKAEATRTEPPPPPPQVATVQSTDIKKDPAKV